MTPQLHRSSNAPELWDTIEAFEWTEPATYLYCVVHSAVAPVQRSGAARPTGGSAAARWPSRIPCGS